MFHLNQVSKAFFPQRLPPPGKLQTYIVVSISSVTPLGRRGVLVAPNILENILQCRLDTCRFQHAV